MFQIIEQSKDRYFIVDSYANDESYVNKEPILTLREAVLIKTALTLEYSEKYCSDESKTTYKELDLSNVHKM